MAFTVQVSLTTFQIIIVLYIIHISYAVIFLCVVLNNKIAPKNNRPYRRYHSYCVIYIMLYYCTVCYEYTRVITCICIRHVRVE